MAIISESKFGDTAFQRLLGHNTDVAHGWAHLGDILEKDGMLSSELKEQVRRTLAQSNGCEYCKAKGKPDPDKYDEKMAMAVGFAEVFLKQKGQKLTSAIEILKAYFTEEEISELCAFIAFTTASQYFGAMLGLKAESI